MNKITYSILKKDEDDYCLFIELFKDVWNTEFYSSVQLPAIFKQEYFLDYSNVLVGFVNNKPFGYIHWFSSILELNPVYENILNYLINGKKADYDKIIYVETFGIVKDFRAQKLTYPLVHHWFNIQLDMNKKYALFCVNLPSTYGNEKISQNIDILKLVKNKWNTGNILLNKQELELLMKDPIVSLYHKFNGNFYQIYRKDSHTKSSRGYCLIGYSLIRTSD